MAPTLLRFRAENRPSAWVLEGERFAFEELCCIDLRRGGRAAGRRAGVRAVVSRSRGLGRRWGSFVAAAALSGDKDGSKRDARECEKSRTRRLRRWLAGYKTSRPVEFLPPKADPATPSRIS
jgi:hypothetical protein